MRARRAGAVALMATVMILGGTIVSAAAQVVAPLYTITKTAECNTATGQFDLTVTLSDAPDAPFLLTDARYVYALPGSPPPPLASFPGKVTNVDSGGFSTAFDPSIMPAPPETASARFSVPGDSVVAQLLWNVPEAELADFTTFQLSADCVAVPTTTVPDTTPEATVPPAAEPAAAAAPRFTG